MKASLRLFAAVLLFSPVTGTYAEKPSGRLAEVLQPFVDKHELAGAVVLVADKDKVLDTETVGYSDIAAKKSMAKDSLHWIASMSKPMTGAAFMILVDEGKVKMDDPVEKYLPEFKGQMVIAEQDADHILLKRPAHPIRLRDILSHTSGLAFKSPIETPTLDLIPLETAVRSHASLPLVYEPETKYQYSNAGINTAGRVIEVVSGMKYEDFMQKRLFEPLGMKDTTFWPNEEQVQRLAKSYKPNASKDNLEELQITQLYYPLTDRKRQPMPGGGLFSTAQDVAKFGQMVLNGGTFEGKRLISEESVKQMTSRQTPAALKNAYGYGWAVSPDNFGHGGAYATNLTVDPKNGIVTVFMVQHSGFPGEGGKSGGKFREAAVKLFGKKG